MMPSRTFQARKWLAAKALAAGLMAAAPASALAQACLQPAEKTGFDVRALQSQLMVVAITCGNQDDYNRFVTSNQPDLAAAYRSLFAHFRRTGGGQRATDAFITDLANRHSQVGIQQGSLFCQNQMPLFQQVSALRGQQALAQFSTERQIPNQYQPPLCTTARPAAAARPPQPRPQGEQAPRPAQPRPAASTAAQPAR